MKVKTFAAGLGALALISSLISLLPKNTSAEKIDSCTKYYEASLKDLHDARSSFTSSIWAGTLSARSIAASLVYQNCRALERRH